MSANTPVGPPISDNESVYRAVLYEIHWAAESNRPSSALFDEGVFSVEIASRTTPEKTASRKRWVLKIVEFSCGQARMLGFDTRDERDEIAPENVAHAHVYSPSEGRKGKARQLAKACKIVEFDPKEAENLRAISASRVEAGGDRPPASQVTP